MANRIEMFFVLRKMSPKFFPREKKILWQVPLRGKSMDWPLSLFANTVPVSEACKTPEVHENVFKML